MKQQHDDNNDDSEYAYPNLREVNGKMVYYTEEEIPKIPIIKTFGWVLSDKRKKEVMETGMYLTVNEFNMLRNGIKPISKE